MGQWSRGLSFVKEMSRSDDVRKTKSELCRAQSTMWSPRRGSCFESKSEYVNEELSMCYCNKDERTKTRVKNVMMMVLRRLSNVAFTDSESAVGSKEVDRVGEEPNVMGIVRVVEFDTRVLRESRQMEIDVVNQLDVNCKRPRQWASSFPVIPRKWVDVNGEGAEQLEYCSRWCEEELEGSSSNVKCETFDMMSRKITLLDASATCWVVSASSDVASELPTDEQVVCQDFLGELSCSLSGMRTEVCNWDKKLQEVFGDNTQLLATTYQSRSCRREREFCGFVHDHFITKGDSVQLMWIESRLKERWNYERCADLGRRWS